MSLIKLNTNKSDNFCYPLKKKYATILKKKLFLYLFGKEKTVLFLYLEVCIRLEKQYA